MPRRTGSLWTGSGDWVNFCISSENLGDVQGTLGCWADAERTARQAVEASGWIADQFKSQFRRWVALAKLGRALHGQGRLAEAALVFTESESLKVKWSAVSPTLIGQSGFDYDQLLLEMTRDADDRRAVWERACVSLVLQQQRGHLLNQAFDHCMIGQSLDALGEPDLQVPASEALDRAVATMRRAGNMRNLPLMHIARAHHHRDCNCPDLAQADLDAALAIARRGKMQTYIADGALLAGHLHLDRLVCLTAPDPPAADPIPEAARAWAEADEIIRRTGYGRRETELHLLEARLRHYQSRPEQAAAALERAESRIRAIGQWGLWPRLCQVAAELGREPPPLP